MNLCSSKTTCVSFVVVCWGVYLSYYHRVCWFALAEWSAALAPRSAGEAPERCGGAAAGRCICTNRCSQRQGACCNGRQNATTTIFTRKRCVTGLVCSESDVAIALRGCKSGVPNRGFGRVVRFAQQSNCRAGSGKGYVVHQCCICFDCGQG